MQIIWIQSNTKIKQNNIKFCKVLYWNCMGNTLKKGNENLPIIIKWVYKLTRITFHWSGFELTTFWFIQKNHIFFLQWERFYNWLGQGDFFFVYFVHTCPTIRTLLVLLTHAHQHYWCILYCFCHGFKNWATWNTISHTSYGKMGSLHCPNYITFSPKSISYPPKWKSTLPPQKNRHFTHWQKYKYFLIKVVVVIT